jgi:hypothetical protein
MSEQGQYDGETCGSCVLFDACDDIFDGSLPCDDFKPSLQCRQARALEGIDKSLRRIVSGRIEIGA